MLGGLAERACQHILEAKQVFGTAGDYAALARLYGEIRWRSRWRGEPIRTLYASSISAFLASGHAFFNGVGELFEQQFARSTPLEQALLLWLAIARSGVAGAAAGEPGGHSRAARDAGRPGVAATAAADRAGVRQPAFTLQPVILEYLTDRLVREVCQEIVAGRPALPRSHALRRQPQRIMSAAARSG